MPFISSRGILNFHLKLSSFSGGSVRDVAMVRIYSPDSHHHLREFCGEDPAVDRVSRRLKGDPIFWQQNRVLQLANW
jgi:hypothetical protein